MTDSTKLRWNRSRIWDVGYILLSCVGAYHPEAFADAIESGSPNSFDNSKSRILLLRAVASSSSAHPEIFAGRIARWLHKPWLRLCAEAILNSTPSTHASQAIRAVEDFISMAETPEAEVSSVLSRLGSIGSALVLEFFQRQIKFPERQTGVALGCESLFADFPIEVSELIQKLRNQESLRKDTFGALVSCCRAHASSLGVISADVFARATKEYPEVYNREIAISVSDCLQSPAMTAFVESQVLVETDGLVFEQYLYYIKRFRRLTSADIYWVRRWINSGGPFNGLLCTLALSKIPFHQMENIIQEVDYVASNYLEHTSKCRHSRDRKALKRLASRIVRSAMFVTLSPDAREWFSRVSQDIRPQEL